MRHVFKKYILTFASISMTYPNPHKHGASFDIESIRAQHAYEILKDQGLASRTVKGFKSTQSMENSIEGYIAQINPSIDAQAIANEILKISYKYHYDPMFILSVIKTESRFNPKAVGSAGEIGLMQIKPATAEWIVKKYKMTWKGQDALFDPVYNIQVGALYFKYLKKAFKSESKSYINAYNVGQSRLKRSPASVSAEYSYYQKVVGNYLTIYNKMSR